MPCSGGIGSVTDVCLGRSAGDRGCEILLAPFGEEGFDPEDQGHVLADGTEGGGRVTYR